MQNKTKSGYSISNGSKTVILIILVCLAVLLAVLSKSVSDNKTSYDSRSQAVVSQKAQQTQASQPDFPAYPDARTLEYAPISNGNRLSLETDAAVPQVTDWYVNTLPQSGWNITIPPSQSNVFASTVSYIEIEKPDQIVQISIVKKYSTSHIIADFFSRKTWNEMGEESEGK